MRLPNTPSQRWARAKSACLGGRRRLGKRSLAQYWASCPDRDLHDLYWIARHLLVPSEWTDDAVFVEARQAGYQQALTNAYGRANHGRWRGQRVRAALEAVITAHRVHFPMWCF